MTFDSAADTVEPKNSMHRPKQINLLHITAHLGGGVGKVLSRLIEESARRQDGVKHTIACMEKPRSGSSSNMCRHMEAN